MPAPPPERALEITALMGRAEGRGFESLTAHQQVHVRTPDTHEVWGVFVSRGQVRRWLQLGAHLAERRAYSTSRAAQASRRSRRHRLLAASLDRGAQRPREGPGVLVPDRVVGLDALGAAGKLRAGRLSGQRDLHVVEAVAGQVILVHDDVGDGVGLNVGEEPLQLGSVGARGVSPPSTNSSTMVAPRVSAFRRQASR